MGTSDEDKNNERKERRLTDETNKETPSPLASHVENLQKFANSMKEQIVEKVEEIKTKTNNNKNNKDKDTAADTDDDVDENNDSSGKVNNIENSQDHKSLSFRSADIQEILKNEETKTDAVWLAPVEPAEAAKV